MSGLVFIFIVIVLAAATIIVLLTAKNKNEHYHPDQLKQPHFLRLGKEVTVSDPLLYDGSVNEGVVDSYMRNIDGTDIVLDLKKGRGISELPLVLNAEAVEQVRTKLKRENDSVVDFFILHGYLVLIFSDEINNGRWFSEILGAWKIDNPNFAKS